MCKDHDYVTMADYKADTKELAEYGAAIAQSRQIDIKNRERAFIAAVLASGGRLEIPDGCMAKACGLELKWHRNEADGVTVYEIES